MRRTVLPRVLLVLGTVLVLGGTAHFFGIACLYISQGLPPANRVLLDVWIGQAQILGGALDLLAARALRRREPARALTLLGALIVIGYAGPVLPVLFSRAPPIFRVAPSVYLAASLFMLVETLRGLKPKPGSESGAMLGAACCVQQAGPHPPSGEESIEAHTPLELKASR